MARPPPTLRDASVKGAVPLMRRAKVSSAPGQSSATPCSCASLGAAGPRAGCVLAGRATAAAAGATMAGFACCEGGLRFWR